VFFVRLKPFLVLPVFDQLQVLIERRVSSSLQGGAIATVDYARTLTDTAVLLVSQPLGLALLHKGSSEDARAQMDIVTRRMLAVTLPAALFLMVFAPDIVRLLFARGAFTSADVETTTQAVRGISAGLWASVIAWILIRILNNTGRNGEAIRILCVGYAINAGLNVAALMVPASLGLLVIGLGEAARGLFLLVAIAVALGGLRLLLSALGRSLPIAGGLAALLVMLNLGVDSTLLRLSGGIVLTLAASAGLLHILDRDQLRKVIVMIKARLSASGSPS
jgi:putative peptidoglycan lipid II flippase